MIQCISNSFICSISCILFLLLLSNNQIHCILVHDTPPRRVVTSIKLNINGHTNTHLNNILDVQEVDNKYFISTLPKSSFTYDGNVQLKQEVGDIYSLDDGSEPNGVANAYIDENQNALLSDGVNDEEEQYHDLSSMVNRKMGLHNNGGRSKFCTFKPSICKDTHSTTDTCCQGQCVFTINDINHCGECGNKCGLMESCCNGQCVDVSTSSSHCGKCGNSCPSSAPCEFGMCGYY